MEHTYLPLPSLTAGSRNPLSSLVIYIFLTPRPDMNLRTEGCRYLKILPKQKAENVSKTAATSKPTDFPAIHVSSSNCKMFNTSNIAGLSELKRLQ